MKSHRIKQIKLGIIGAGNMGQAIASAVRQEFTVQACDKDQRRLATVCRKLKIKSLPLEKLAAESRVILLAVKPQDFPELLGRLAPYVDATHTVISIAAGVTTATIEKFLGGRPRVIRTMPNMPAQIGEGMTAICRGRYAKTADENIARQIFRLVGRTVNIKENMMDAVTAVSGSGPAYVFFFAECLMKASRSLGLSCELSAELLEATLLGSLHQLAALKADPASLRAKVTSKGGTTEAAMKVFVRHKTEAVFREALRAAKSRARQLRF